MKKRSCSSPILIFCAIIVCCLIVGIGGFSLYDYNQILVNGTLTANKDYGPLTATAVANSLTQAPNNPDMLAPECKTIVNTINGMEPGDITAYTSSLTGKWIINWRTRIVFFQSFPFFTTTDPYFVINAMTDDGCGMGIEYPEISRPTLHENQYINVTGQIRKTNIVAGVPTFDIGLATSRVNP